MASVSIVIPTLNGASTIPQLLQMIKCQKTTHKIEISIIDSGSTDDTLKILENYSSDLKIILSNVSQKEFNHGTSRNEAISKSNGEFIALLTQDAIPFNEYWLENLVRPLLEDDIVAGVFGRHLPRSDCNPIERKNLNEFFRGFGYKNVSYQLQPKFTRDAPMDYLVALKKEYDKRKHLLAFFSDNNGCIRRTVWEKIPYRCVLILGEDQIWARDILFAGYKKVYTPHAIVIHSHNYSPIKSFQRWVDDMRFLRELHNYSTQLPLWKTLLFCLKMAKNNFDYVRSISDPKQKQKWKWYSIKIAYSRILAEYVAKIWDKIPNFMKPYLSVNERHQKNLASQIKVQPTQ